MSQLKETIRKRKDLLKHLILQLHKGQTPEQVKTQLARLLGEVPYNEVVEVEQELISEGLPQEEVLKLCDVHTAVLKGQIDVSAAKTVPPGHPVDTFKKENRALEWEIAGLQKVFDEISALDDQADPAELTMKMRLHFNALSDVDKHYRRKENLLFPFLEKHGITGPPTVMWGKHDETRKLLKVALDALRGSEGISAGEAKAVVDLALKPAATAVEEMIYKEEQILFPMSLDTLSDDEWYGIYKQSTEIGFCLYDPEEEWVPERAVEEEVVPGKDERAEDKIQFPSGSMTVRELTAVLNTIPFDLTFVDAEDTVRYFTQGRERIFDRNRAVLGRKVQLCHPPKSVHIVEKILDDFKSGKESRAPFWINLGGRFVHIEYIALRDSEGKYMGTLEVSQDLTEKRALEGEQRLLSYAKE